MSELRIASNFRSHPKFIDLTRLAPSIGVDLWLSMMAFCNQNLTDGLISVEQSRCVEGPKGRWRGAALRALVEVGLVERVDDLTLRMHDYLDWNPPASTVLAKRRERNQNRPTRSGQRGNAWVETQVTREKRHGSDTSNACVETYMPRAELKDDEQLSLGGMGYSRARAPSSSSSSTSDPDPPLPSPSGGQPDPVEKKSRQPRRVAGSIRSRCIADFEPDATTLALATSLGFTIGLERKSRAEFVDYWIGEGKLKSDWQATYRNRLRKVAELRGLKPVVKSAPGPHSGPRMISPAERYVPTQAEYREALAKVHQLFPS
jgi:hypothetical protein